MTEQTALDDPLKSNNFPEREFYTAAEDGDVDTVCTLLLRLPGYLNSNMDETPFKIFVGALTRAVANGHANVTRVMLEKLDADQVLTAATAVGGNRFSAMTRAAASDYVGVMTALLAKLDTGNQVLTAVAAPDGTGLSAMTLAAANGHANVMMAMVTMAQEKGAMAMVTMGQEKGVSAAQIAEMFLKRDERNKNAIEWMNQKTFDAVWEKLPKDVQSQLIADHRFPADKKTSVPVGILHAAFAEVAALKKENEALKKENEALKKENEALKEEKAALQKRVEALEAAAQEKPPAGNAGSSNGDFPKLGQG